MPKKIVNIWLRPDQEERINAIVERSAILDTSKFVRIAVDWLLRSDIGEVIKRLSIKRSNSPIIELPRKPPGEKSGACLLQNNGRPAAADCSFHLHSRESLPSADFSVGFCR